MNVEQPLQEFLDSVCDAFDSLRHHHFVMKSQAAYLRKLKEELTQNVAIILLDFAENYSFIIQDAIQGHYWDNSQATLHPFAIYYKNGDELKCDSFAVISDCLKHDTTAVHCFIAAVLPRLKQEIPDLEKVIYFSDGAVSQYKNYKNFTNLCHHHEEFSLKAEWHFFATSHGKSPCDGIGGTVKRLVARASLQATNCNQILTASNMFQWSHKNIKGVQFLFVSSEDISQHEKDFKLEERYTEAKTVSGTRSHHSFIPVSSHTLEMRRISQDSIFNTVKTSSTQVSESEESRVGLRPVGVHPDDYQPGQYIACMYDNEWFVANIVERSDEQEDVFVKFMKRVNTTLSWPAESRQHSCWVPFQHIICQINAPEIQGHSARQYRLSTADEERIHSLLPELISS